MNRLIDLAEIKNEYLEKSYKVKIKGLKGLVQIVFGKTLDKEEQTSDWLQRPLKTNQIEYAALDSFVLFKLYLKANVMYANKFYDLSKIYQLDFTYPSCRTSVVQSKFTKKEQSLILIDEN
jgi:ribonuclease D